MSISKPTKRQTSRITRWIDSDGSIHDSVSGCVLKSLAAIAAEPMTYSWAPSWAKASGSWAPLWMRSEEDQVRHENLMRRLRCEPDKTNPRFKRAA